MSKIKWYSDGQFEDDEFVEDDVKEELVEGLYLRLGYEHYPIEMDTHFEINRVEYSYKNSTRYAPVRNEIYEKNIKFKEKEAYIRMSKIFEACERSKIKLPTITIEKFSKEGCVIQKLVFHNSRMIYRTNELLERYEIGVRFDYLSMYS